LYPDNGTKKNVKAAHRESDDKHILNNKNHVYGLQQPVYNITKPLNKIGDTTNITIIKNRKNGILSGTAVRQGT
jgi:hypothetical protein